MPRWSTESPATRWTTTTRTAARSPTSASRSSPPRWPPPQARALTGRVCSRGSSRATRSSRGWGWPSGRGSTRAASIRRRCCGVFGATAAAGAPSVGRRGHAHERARHRREHGVGAARVPGRRLLDQAPAPWMGGARGDHRVAPGRPRCDRSRLGVRRPLRALPGVRGARRHRRRGAHRRAWRALGDPEDRVQAVPGVSLPARVGRRDGAGARRDAGADRGHRGDRRAHPGGRRLARARATGRQAPAAHRIRGEVQPAVLDRVAARARARRRLDLHRRGDHRPRRAGGGGQGPLRGQGLRHLPRRVPRRRPHPHAATGARSRPSCPTSGVARRTR